MWRAHRGLRITLCVLGVLFVAASITVKWVLAPAAIKLPLSPGPQHDHGPVNITSAEGDATVFILVKGGAVHSHVLATRYIKGDTEAGDSHVAVWDESLCVTAPGAQIDPHTGCAPSSDLAMVQQTTDRIAIDRKSAESVNDPKYKEAVDGKPVKHTGLGYTFPIGTKKQTYQFFDPIAHAAYPADYIATSSISGLTVYEFKSVSPLSNITVDGFLPATYEGSRVVYVEPRTGLIIKGVQVIKEVLSTGTTAFDGTLTFTDKAVASQASYAKDLRHKMDLAQRWIPLAALVLGVLCLLGAFWRGRGPRTQVQVPPVDMAGDNR
jgi:hypothetical protein